MIPNWPNERLKLLVPDSERIFKAMIEIVLLFKDDRFTSATDHPLTFDVSPMGNVVKELASSEIPTFNSSFSFPFFYKSVEIYLR